MKSDQEYMEMALEYARANAVGSEGQVGAILVKDGEIIAQGASDDPKKLHAEQVVLEKADENARGATLYVTIQPSLYRTDESIPSDSEVIAEAGVSRVVVGSLNKKYSLEESEAFFAERGVRFELVEDKTLAEKCLDFFISTGADQTPRIIPLIIGFIASTLSSWY